MKETTLYFNIHESYYYVFLRNADDTLKALDTDLRNALYSLGLKITRDSLNNRMKILARGRNYALERKFKQLIETEEEFPNKVELTERKGYLAITHLEPVLYFKLQENEKLSKVAMAIERLNPKERQAIVIKRDSIRHMVTIYSAEKSCNQLIHFYQTLKFKNMITYCDFPEVPAHQIRLSKNRTLFFDFCSKKYFLKPQRLDEQVEHFYQTVVDYILKKGINPSFSNHSGKLWIECCNEPEGKTLETLFNTATDCPYTQELEKQVQQYLASYFEKNNMIRKRKAEEGYEVEQLKVPKSMPFFHANVDKNEKGIISTMSTLFLQSKFLINKVQAENTLEEREKLFKKLIKLYQEISSQCSALQLSQLTLDLKLLEPITFQINTFLEEMKAQTKEIQAITIEVSKSCIQMKR